MKTKYFLVILSLCTIKLWTLQINFQIDEKKSPFCIKADKTYLLPLKSTELIEIIYENNLITDITGKLKIKKNKFSLFTFFKKKKISIQISPDLEVF